IGPVKAQAIIDYRTKNGPFKALADVKNVDGVGDATFEKIRTHINLTGQTTVPATAPSTAPAPKAEPKAKADTKPAAAPDAEAKKTEAAKPTDAEAKKTDSDAKKPDDKKK